MQKQRNLYFERYSCWNKLKISLNNFFFSEFFLLLRILSSSLSSFFFWDYLFGTLTFKSDDSGSNPEVVSLNSRPIGSSSDALLSSLVSRPELWDSDDCAPISFFHHDLQNEKVTIIFKKKMKKIKRSLVMWSISAV